MMHRFFASLVFAALVSTLSVVADIPDAVAETNTNSVTFSVERGYITSPITVELSGAANIVYSTSWGDEWLASDFQAVAQPYSGPITVTGTTQLRAMAIGDEHAVSHTYVDISGYSANDRAIIESYPAMITTGESVGEPEFPNQPPPKSDTRTIVEFWHPNGTSASAPAGIRNRQHGVGQDGDFRLFFRNEYGDGRLDYDLFPNEPTGAQPAGSHDKVNFHGGSQDRLGYVWPQHHGCVRPGAGTLMRDRFFQRLQRKLNGDGVSGEYYLMWHRDRFVGLKNAEDVPQQGFMEEHFGGDKDDYGLWTFQSRELPPGNPYNSRSVDDFRDAIDLVNYVDYLIVTWFSGNTDWGSRQTFNNNVVVGGLFDGPYYHWVWDSHATDPGCDSNWGAFPMYTAYPFRDLDVRTMFADRAYLHFENGGAMTDPELLALWDGLAEELAPGVPLVYDGDWSSAEQSMRNRVGNAAPALYSWMQSNDFASSVQPVTYSLDAGAVPSESSLALTGGDEIWFTMGGTDPRAPGGGVSAAAQRYEEPIALPDGTVQMLARVKSGDSWSAARPMIFQVDAPSLVISEATAEYVEITNSGAVAIDLEYWRLQGDVRHKFDYNRSPILQPGESAVIAENAETFTARWGFPPDGQFLDAINGTETLRLVDTELNVQHEITSPLYDDSVPANAPPRVAVAADPPGMILNEWNAVSNSETPTDADPLLGTIEGNGGDWFELVTVNDVDLRGWTLDVSDADSFSTIELTNDAVWADVPAGTIITFSEDVVVSQAGASYPTDMSLDPDNNDWWMHVVTDEANAYVTQTTFAASADGWTIEIRNNAGAIQWGPVGEGVGALVAGVGNDEVGELEANPAPTLDPVTAPYDDGNGSTFGAPNTYGDATQYFDTLRGLAQPGPNVDCDNVLTIVDALFIAQYAVRNRSDHTCPLGDPATQINAAAGDIDKDGNTNIVDALLISQCAVDIDNGYCPPPAD